MTTTDELLAEILIAVGGLPDTFDTIDFPNQSIKVGQTIDALKLDNVAGKLWGFTISVSSPECKVELLIDGRKKISFNPLDMHRDGHTMPNDFHPWLDRLTDLDEVEKVSAITFAPKPLIPVASNIRITVTNTSTIDTIKVLGGSARVSTRKVRSR